MEKFTVILVVVSCVIFNFHTWWIAGKCCKENETWRSLRNGSRSINVQRIHTSSWAQRWVKTQRCWIPFHLDRCGKLLLILNFLWITVSLFQPLHICLLGLDSAGKTTALYRMKFDQYLNTVPTIGFNCEKIRGMVGKAKGVSFLVWGEWHQTTTK